MRTGHMTAAFFTPSASARDFIASRMLSSSQLGSAARRSAARARNFFALSRVDLDFLFSKRSGPYSGRASKKPSLPGMSVSTSVRCCKSAATAAGSMAGFFTASRI